MVDNIPKDIADVVIDDKNDVSKKTIMAKLRNYFLAGVVVTAPIAITTFIVWKFLEFLDEKITPFIPYSYNPNTYLPFNIPGFGLIITVVFFIVVGWFTRNFLGRLMVRWSEYIVERVPVINKIYVAIKHVMETITSSHSDAFKEVVMFEYPKKDIWVIGFVTGVSKGEVQEKTSDETINIFVPTTPNPTSGFLLFIPKKDLIYMDMSVEEGIKLVVSGGIITPSEKK